jgi:HD-GYP domain-containing protein (c-di-GMP phosphodiesterase class II)
MSLDVAVAELTANSGTQFDPAVVAAVLEALERPSPSSAAAARGSKATVVPTLAEPSRTHAVPR